MGKPETRRLAGREIAPVSDTAALPLPLVWDTTRNPLSWPFWAFPCLLTWARQGSEHADLLSGSYIWLHLACGVARNLGIFAVKSKSRALSHEFDLFNTKIMLKTALQIALIQVLAFSLPVIVGFTHKGIEVYVYSFQRNNCVFIGCAVYVQPQYRRIRVLA